MLNKDGNIPLVEIFSRERRGWDLYYDVLDIVEKHIAERDHFALELADRAKQIINSLGLNQNS
ncbi:MAG: hypothetical protein A2176_14080 [Spirochaetes bacterium RBG_13_51_14]|nr:MAG: hypothetical protein A2176_14080 [Spirochaetes bacterium RBG_13_51_14]